ncbi:hypothetical protein WJX77_000283 [Trebouxia sp. C0004]
MKIRFSNLIKELRQLGSEVTVFTPCVDPPKSYCGAKVVSVLGFSLPFYKSPTLLLSLGLSIRVFWYLVTRRPDVIHVSSPGLLVFSAIMYAKLLAIPLVVSYHTHIPEYIPKYTWRGLVEPMWNVIRYCTLVADLTLVPSKAMKLELSRNNCRDKRIDVWPRAVDTAVFNPAFRSQAMRERLTKGNPKATILVYVGRLGAEKNLEVLKEFLPRLPANTHLSFVGGGPHMHHLQTHFKGCPVTFTGMLRGADLSAAYASADIFMMPSETETLGFVALEAMASGLPVVAVAAGGLTDIITHPGVTSFLYPPGDYEQAIQHTHQLVSDPGFRRTMAAAARAEVERFGWKAAIRRVRNLQYQRAIRIYKAHKRFGTLALRVRTARFFQAVFAMAVAVLGWAVHQLDYARQFRPAKSDWQPQVQAASTTDVKAAAATTPFALQYTGLLQRFRLKLLEASAFLTERDELLVVAASTLLCSLSHSALRPVLPVFAKGFGVGTAAVGMTISTYALARLMMNLPAGILADRHGRKLLLVWGPAITALGMFGCGMAGSFQQLLAWRWVTGLGSALQMSGSQLCLADISRADNRARCLGTNQACITVKMQTGSFIGPAVGGVLADTAGFRAPFTFTAAAALLAALYVFVRLPNSDRQYHRPQQRPTQLHQSSSEQRVKTAPEATQTAGLARSPQPKWLQLLLCPNFGSIALVSAVMFMTQNGARAVLLPLLAMQGFGLSAKLLGMTFSGMAVVSLMVVMPASMAADALGRKWTIIPSCLAIAAALGLMAVSALYAVGNACIGASPVAYAADVMPANLGGFGLGMYRCAGDLGLMLGPMFLGWVADFSSVRVALQVNAVLLVLTMVYFGLVAAETKQT